MDPKMKQLQKALVDIETDAEQLLLARHQEALTTLRKRARTTKTSVPSPFEVIMKEMEGTSGKLLVTEICSTRGNHNPKEDTWLISSRASRLRHQEAIQSFVKEKSFVISEKGALGIVKSLVSLTDSSQQVTIHPPKTKYLKNKAVSNVLPQNMGLIFFSLP
uniref:Uncharacterized protein n=1 Tax=Oryza rufipogon TaxID=4529 RepID=A0A0E0PYS2_ORYRU